MGAYDFNFDLPPGETYAPSADRMRALEALLPKEPFAFAPKVTDRAAWDPWKNDPFGQRTLKTARELAAQPFPDYTNAAYLDCLAKEDVTHINIVMPLARKRQVAFFLAEAIYDQGEFLNVLASDTREPHERFNELARKVVTTPKTEVDKRDKQWHNDKKSSISER